MVHESYHSIIQLSFNILDAHSLCIIDDWSTHQCFSCNTIFGPFVTYYVVRTMHMVSLIIWLSVYNKGCCMESLRQWLYKSLCSLLRLVLVCLLLLWIFIQESWKAAVLCHTLWQGNSFLCLYTEPCFLFTTHIFIAVILLFLLCILA